MSDRIEQSKKAMKRLRTLGEGGFVVLSREGGGAGIGNNFPCGIIVGFGDYWTVYIRRIGQRSSTAYCAIFWQPMPQRLVDCFNGERV